MKDALTIVVFHMICSGGSPATARSTRAPVDLNLDPPAKPKPVSPQPIAPPPRVIDSSSAAPTPRPYIAGSTSPSQPTSGLGFGGRPTALAST